jgi:purine-binding chemotaxis protein CheW
VNGKVHLFLLLLDEQRYALRVSGVVRVVRMVEITAMPQAACGVLGLVNVQGEVLPVVDLRSSLGHPARQLQPQDVLIIAGTGSRKVALPADAVAGVVEYPEQAVVADREMLRRPEYLEGVVKLPDGLVLVCDLERILSLCSEPWPQGQRQERGFPPPQAVTAGDGAARRLLRDRAQKLAREPEAEGVQQRLELVEFLLSGENYAIESLFIREVYPLRELTPLPCTPPFVLGIVNLRGKILSVIDMRKFFDLREQGLSDLNKVIIVHDARMEFGILADAILGVRTILGGELQPSLPTLTEIGAEYLKGVTRDRLVVLDAGKMLADHRIVVHEEA